MGIPSVAICFPHSLSENCMTASYRDLSEPDYAIGWQTLVQIVFFIWNWNCNLIELLIRWIHPLYVHGLTIKVREQCGSLPPPDLKKSKVYTFYHLKGILLEYSLQENVLEIDAIKEHLLGFCSVFGGLKELFSVWDSTHFRLWLIFDIFQSTGYEGEGLRILSYVWPSRVPHNGYRVGSSQFKIK